MFYLCTFFEFIPKKLCLHCFSPAPLTLSWGPCTVFFQQNWCLGGKQRRFSCANVSQFAHSNQRPAFSRDRGLRHSLNNLAALCHHALGSQPSKVMTERCRLTSPPMHSHYHLFTVHDSRKTKQEGPRWGERNHWRCINCVIKHSTTKQWHFQSIPKLQTLLSCAILRKNHTTRQTKEMMDTYTDKRLSSDAQDGQVSVWKLHQRTDQDLDKIEIPPKEGDISVI